MFETMIGVVWRREPMMRATRRRRQPRAAIWHEGRSILVRLECRGRRHAGCNSRKPVTMTRLGIGVAWRGIARLGLGLLLSTIIRRRWRHLVGLALAHQ